MMNMAMRTVPVSVLSVLLATGSFVPVSSSYSGNENAQVPTYYLNVSVFVDNLNCSYGTKEDAINFTLGLFNLINLRFRGYNNGSVTQFSIMNITEVTDGSLPFLNPIGNATEIRSGTLYEWEEDTILPVLGEWRKNRSEIPASAIAVVLSPMKLNENGDSRHGYISGTVCITAAALIHASPKDFESYSGAPRVMAKLLGAGKDDDENEYCPVSGSLPFELPDTLKSCITAAPRPDCASKTKPGCWRGEGYCDEKYLPGENITSNAMFCELILDGAVPGNTTVDDPCIAECCTPVKDETSNQFSHYVCHNRTFLDGMTCKSGSGKCINFACRTSA